MTRQIALGAVVAFSVTVLALSVWEPRPVVASPPAPVPVVSQGAPPPALMKLVRPLTLKNENMTQTIRSPRVIAQPIATVPAADSGS